MILFCFCACVLALAVSINIGGLHMITRDWLAGSAFTALALASGAGVWATMGEFAI
jgi:hypothetical protein